MDDPSGRTKNKHEHRVYLTQTAMDLLKDVTRVEDEPYVFVGYRGKRQMAGINTVVFASIRRRRNPRHAMRDTVATGLGELGVAIEDISRVLNHRYGSAVTAIGQNSYAGGKERRLALTKWGRRLDQILADEKRDAPKVVAIAG